MNNPIARERCKHHREREASVKCPSCGYFYCSECSIEHDGRFVCRTCLASLKKHSTTGRRSWIGRAVFTISSLAAFLTVWFLFFYLGEILLSIPDAWFEKNTVTTRRTAQ
jgi:hypothetical protein